MNVIKHLPLTLIRDLIKYNVYFLDCLCQNCKDSKWFLLQLLTRINDSRNDTRNYNDGTCKGEKKAIIVQTVLAFLLSKLVVEASY